MSKTIAASVRRTLTAALVITVVLSGYLPWRSPPGEALALETMQGLQWQKVTPDAALSHAFTQAVRPYIQAAVTGAYGGTPLYENEKVVEIRQLRDDPKVVEVEIRVETFSGAHNPLGTATIVFRITPTRLYVGEVRTTTKRQDQGQP